MFVNSSLDNERPDVSIVIRAKNEALRIEQCLKMIGLQKGPCSAEVILIDSGSTDGTVAIARRYPFVRIIHIPSYSFNYGRSLNQGVQQSEGRFIVCLSAHCVPTDRTWLYELLQPLLLDEKVGASFSRQIPWPECEPVERTYLEGAFPAHQQPFIEGGDTFGGSHDIPFSNAGSCLRRDLAIAIPFRELSYGEDRAWASEVLSRGYKIAYCSRSIIFHSHQRSVRDYYRLGVALGKARAEMGQPPYRLRDSGWFGPRRFYWSWDYWRVICSHRGIPSLKASTVALSCVFRLMAQSIGLCLGYSFIVSNKASLRVALVPIADDDSPSLTGPLNRSGVAQ